MANLITVTCPLTGPGAAACAAAGTALHELIIADEPFGENGEVVKFFNKTGSELQKLFFWRRP